MAASELKRVLVTGASGFIASDIVRQLLASNKYLVRGTVRDPSNAEKTAHLRALEGASDRLELVKGDLLDVGAFDDAVKDCVGVFHTASPFWYGGEEDLIKPAVDGTKNVLDACRKAGVKRVIVTSSCAAVVANDDGPKDASKGWSADDWSDAVMLREKEAWYPLSKTLAERAAWDLAKEHGLEVTTINPTLVTGPMLQEAMNTSSKLVMNIMTGKRESLSTGYMSFVDVRDVAQAHIAAFENPASIGKRYIMVASSIPWTRVGDVIRENMPEDRRAEATSKVEEKEETPTLYHTEPAKTDLGINFISSEDSIADSVKSILASKHYK